LRVSIKSKREGTTVETLLDTNFLATAEFEKPRRLAQSFATLGMPPYKLRNGEDEWEAKSLSELVEAVLTHGKKGQYIQRYKGLGEMNPDQLWKTTMDPEQRTLLQVRMDDSKAADEIFTVLMGDQVEPRREFIEANALDVRNLDI
jgi:DNA gyrase subunit B